LRTVDKRQKKILFLLLKHSRVEHFPIITIDCNRVMAMASMQCNVLVDNIEATLPKKYIYKKILLIYAKFHYRLDHQTFLSFFFLSLPPLCDINSFYLIRSLQSEFEA
jgi:hypothetical protein